MEIELQETVCVEEYICDVRVEENADTHYQASHVGIKAVLP